jgi:diguanylate cyclase (GGDEF)-like protein
LSSIRLLLPAWLCLLAGTAAHSACLAPAQGELAPLEVLAFRAPAVAEGQLKQWAARADMQAPAQRATLSAIRAEVARQLAQEGASLAHAEAGLAALAPDTHSDLALRLRTVRDLQWHDDRRALADLDAAVAGAGERPLVQGCLLRDRGLRKVDTDDIEGALADLIRAYKLLGQHGERDDQVVATGRLAIAYAAGGDHTAALALIDETVEHFRRTNAPVRLATALQRRADSLTMLERLPEAEAAVQEALAVSLAHGDIGGAGALLVSLCRVVGLQDRETDALAHCAQAERRLREGHAFDDAERGDLELLRIEVLRSRAPDAAELATLQRAVQAASTGGTDRQIAVHEARAKALAAHGDYRAAHADLQRVLALKRVAGERARVNSQAAMRVRFETDRALERGTVLAEQTQRAKERLWWVAAAAVGLLAAVAGLGCALVLNRRHQLRLAEVADRDDLTGLPNRRKIVEHAEHQFALERRRGGSLVIGMLDIDHFKQINDRHGHEGGDRVLRALGAMASGALRSTDTLGRWGGEEFLLVLPDCPPAAGALVAERLRSSLGAQAVAGSPGGSGEAIRFSVSIGLAAALPGDATLQALLQRADGALYAAKAAGRDRVVFDAPAAARPRQLGAAAPIQLP